MKHMREVHDTKLSDRQLRVVANRNSRKTTKLFPSCPLCGREESEVDGRLEDHLAGHLRSLALKSLPSYQDEIPEDAEGEKNSIDGSRPRSRSTIREMEEEKEQMLEDGAESFWENWAPQLTQIISINFLGDAHIDLDLGSREAHISRRVFDAIIFRDSPENLDDDPILQSILQHQLARIEVIDTGADDSSGLSTEQEGIVPSKTSVGESSEQDEVSNTLMQQPVDAESAHVQAATTEQDTEVDSPREDEIPETLIEPTTKAPPVTTLDIPVDAEDANLSNVPIDKMSEQDEVGQASTQGSANAETVHAQIATVEKDAEVILPKKDEDPKPNPTARSHLIREPYIPADLVKGDLFTFSRDETPGQEKIDNTAGPGLADSGTLFLKRSKSLYDMTYYLMPMSGKIENHDPSQIDAAVSLMNKIKVGLPLYGSSPKHSQLITIKDHFRDRPEAYERFIEILQAFQAEQTPPLDDGLLLASFIYRRVPGAHWRTLQNCLGVLIPLFESTPDLFEELILHLPSSVVQLRQDVRRIGQALTRRDIFIYGRSIEERDYADSDDPDEGNTVPKT